jgi:hypothetical protein
MKYDSRASLLVRTLANPCFGREPKVRVATIIVKKNLTKGLGLKDSFKFHK